MKVLTARKAQATQDGAGVKINRIAGFDGKSLDPFLMIDELKSDDSGDYMAGFPAHPHRGIETFTYIRKGVLNTVTKWVTSRPFDLAMCSG